MKSYAGAAILAVALAASAQAPRVEECFVFGDPMLHKRSNFTAALAGTQNISGFDFGPR
jgi:hypothetical protein